MAEELTAYGAGSWPGGVPCLTESHYPHDMPPTRLTADPRLHWPDGSPCTPATEPARISEAGRRRAAELEL